VTAKGGLTGGTATEIATHSALIEDVKKWRHHLREKVISAIFFLFGNITGPGRLEDVARTAFHTIRILPGL
jgi:hypothetical protein